MVKLTLEDNLFFFFLNIVQMLPQCHTLFNTMAELLTSVHLYISTSVQFLFPDMVMDRHVHCYGHEASLAHPIPAMAIRAIHVTGK